MMNGTAFLSPQVSIFQAYSDLRERADPGDLVALDRLNKYEAELHLAGSGVDLEPYSADSTADYVLTGNTTRSYPGYALVEVYGSDNGTALMPGFGAALWTRAGSASP